VYCESEGIYIKLDEHQLSGLERRYPETIKLFESISKNE